MVAYIRLSVRALLLAAALVFASQTADAAGHTTEQHQTTARTTAHTSTEPSAGPSTDGVLIIAGVVGLVVLLAWVGSRMGDSRAQ